MNKKRRFFEALHYARDLKRVGYSWGERKAIIRGYLYGWFDGFASLDSIS